MTERYEVDLFEMVDVVWRDRLLFGAIVLLFLIIGVVASAMWTRTYTAQTVVVENVESGASSLSGLMGQLGGLSAIAGLDRLQSSSRGNARGVLESRALARNFIMKRDLVNRFFEGDETPTLEGAVGRLIAIRTVSDDTRLGTIAVAFEWEDPVEAADWANGFVDDANEMVRRLALESAQRNIDFLQERIEGATIVPVQQVLFRLLESETQKLMLASGRPDYAFAVIDPAVPPEQPSWPRPMLLIVATTFAGFLVAATLVLMRDAWRRRAT